MMPPLRDPLAPYGREYLATRRWRLNLSAVLVFVLPLLTAWTVELGGELMFSDIAVALLLPVLLLKRRRSFQQPYLRKIMLLLVLWLIAAVVSDVVNESSARNFMRGAASIVFFGLHLIVFFVLIDQRRARYVAALMGVAVAILLQWATGSDELSSMDLTETPWKMGGGFAVTILLTAFLGGIFRSDRSVGRTLLVLSPIHLFLNARSLFLTTAFAALVAAFSFRVRSQRKRRIVLFTVLILAVVGMPVATGIYGQLAASGIFGEEAQEKYLVQTGGGEINIILGGRSESAISFRAIADAPVLGHGSWAESERYYYMYLSRLQAMGKDVNWAAAKDKDGYLIPAHSMLLGSWVFHGVLAGIFWIYILFLTLKALGAAIAGRRPVPALELLALFALLWDIFFSPFGQARRCTEAVFIVITSCLLEKPARVEEPLLSSGKPKRTEP